MIYANDISSLIYICVDDMTGYIITHTQIHRKSSLYLPLGSVNLVLKLMGTPDGISILNG